jgi:hypothetical protein
MGLVALSQHSDPETAALAADLAVFWKTHIMGLPGRSSSRQSALRDRWANCSCSGWLAGCAVRLLHLQLHQRAPRQQSSNHLLVMQGPEHCCAMLPVAATKLTLS